MSYFAISFEVETMKTSSNFTRAFLLAIVCWCALPRLHAQLAPQSVFDLLTADEGATIVLDIDIDSILKYRKTVQYFPGVLRSGPEFQYDFKVEVRPRGKFRRKRCEMPPLKLKFKKSSLSKHNLDTLNEIKLVLPCADDPASEELVIREYIAYRIYESLSPYSVRARLINLEMKSSKGKGTPQKMIAILVEHEEQVAKRLNGTVHQEWGLKAEQMNTDQVALMLCFEYLIGNTDFDVSAFRNNLQFIPAGDTKVITIPFDFDFSGLVSAPYASPNSETPLKNVRDRCMMTNDIPVESHQKALETIRLHQTEILALCQNNGLRKKTITEMTNYLNHFFTSSADKQDLPAVLTMPAK